MGRRIDQSVWDERREWIEKHQKSGLSVTAFCRDHDLKISQFHFWRQKLTGTTTRKPAVKRPASNSIAPARSSAFVQLPAPVASSSPWVEVSLADGSIVRVPASNLPALKMVLSVLNSPQEVAHV